MNTDVPPPAWRRHSHLPNAIGESHATIGGSRYYPKCLGWHWQRLHGLTTG